METLGVHVLRAVGSGGAAHVLHEYRGLRQIRAATRLPAAASSLELGAVRRVLVANRRRAKATSMSCESVGKNRGRRSSLHFDGLSVTGVGWSHGTAQNFTKVLKHKRVGYTGEEVSRPEPLTLLEIIPQLPPAGAVGIVDPPTSRLVTSMKHSSTQVSSFSKKLNVLEFDQHGCMRLMRSGTRLGRSSFSAV